MAACRHKSAWAGIVAGQLGEGLAGKRATSDRAGSGPGLVAGMESSTVSKPFSKWKEPWWAKAKLAHRGGHMETVRALYKSDAVCAIV